MRHTISFQQLQDSGLPYDFTTVVYGWRKGHLTREQLIDYAMDQIGYCAPEIEGKVVELAFADPTDEWTLNRLADELASDTPDHQQCAARTWRYVLICELAQYLSEYLETLRQMEKQPVNVLDLVDDMVTLEQLFCPDHAIDEEPPDMRPRTEATEANSRWFYSEYWRQIIANYQGWLAEERAALLNAQH